MTRAGRGDGRGAAGASRRRDPASPTGSCTTSRRAPDLPAPLHALLTGREERLGPPPDRSKRPRLRHHRRAGDADAARSRTRARCRARRRGDGAAPDRHRRRRAADLPGARGRGPRAADHAAARRHERDPVHRCPTAEGELTDRNNAAVVQINGVRDRLRVLLVSGEPHAGERTWRNLLKSDSVGGPRALHHPAPAGEAGRRAGRRAVADRLPDARAVPRQDRRVRPDHLRPLQAARASCRRSTSTTSGNTSRTAARVLIAAGPEYASADSLYRSPLGAILPGRADRPRDRGGLPAAR